MRLANGARKGIPQQNQRYLMLYGDPNAQGVVDPSSGAGAVWTPPTVWIEETHHDSVVITEHPVEQGAPISDHAFARPKKQSCGGSCIDREDTAGGRGLKSNE